MRELIEREAAIAIYKASGRHERGCANVNQGGGDCNCGYESGLAKIRSLPSAPTLALKGREEIADIIDKGIVEICEADLPRREKVLTIADAIITSGVAFDVEKMAHELHKIIHDVAPMEFPPEDEPLDGDEAHIDGSSSAIRAESAQHDLFKRGDPDCPDSILDSNGDVALGLCKRCNRGEIELSEPCMPQEQDDDDHGDCDCDRCMWAKQDAEAAKIGATTPASPTPRAAATEGEREAFEKWRVSVYGWTDFTNNGDDEYVKYTNETVNNQWIGWRNARAAIGREGAHKCVVCMVRDCPCDCATCSSARDRRKTDGEGKA